MTELEGQENNLRCMTSNLFIFYVCRLTEEEILIGSSSVTPFQMHELHAERRMIKKNYMEESGHGRYLVVTPAIAFRGQERPRKPRSPGRYSSSEPLNRSANQK
jgi:hypothetical protein